MLMLFFALHCHKQVIFMAFPRVTGPKQTHCLVVCTAAAVLFPFGLASYVFSGPTRSTGSSLHFFESWMYVPEVYREFSPTFTLLEQICCTGHGNCRSLRTDHGPGMLKKFTFIVNGLRSDIRGRHA